MRLILLYLSSTGIGLYLAHRFVRPLTLRPALFLVGLPALFLCEAFVTRGVYAPLDIAYQREPLASYREQYGVSKQRTPILVDVVDMQIPWRKAVRESLKNGRLPLWNRFQMSGEPLLAMPMAQALYPGTWLGFLPPLAQALTFDMALRIFLALVAAYLLLRDMECGDVAACFGATAWALSDFLIFFLGYPPTPAAAPLPLVVMGLRRIAHRQTRSGGGLTILATCMVILAGHPETTLHVICAAGVFFLVVLWRDARGNRVTAASRGFLAGGVAILLTAVALAPFLEVLPHTFEYQVRSSLFAHEPKSVPIVQSLSKLETQCLPYAQGVSGQSDVAAFYEVGSYPGALALVFAAIGLIWARGRDRLPLAVTGLLSLGVALGVRGIGDLVGKLPLFDIAINQRLYFVCAFVLAMLAGLGLNWALREKRWRLVSMVSIGVAALTVTAFAHRRAAMLALRMPGQYMYTRLGWQVLPLFVAAIVALRWARPLASARCAWALPLVLAAVRYGEAGRLYPVAPARAFYPPLDVLSPIDRRAPYRFAAFGTTFVPNMGALYELEDVRAYEAMTLSRLVTTFSLWCTPQAVWFNRVDDPTKPFLSFLNVKYFLAPRDYGAPPGWRGVKTTLAGTLFENEHVLPRAFIPRRIFCANQDGEQLAALHSITDFADAGVASFGCATSRWLANGRADARIVKYQADALAVHVQAQERALLATSIPAWPGWRVLLDGRRAQPLFYNYAFFGLEVPAGRHDVTFEYRPVGFAVGGAVSGLALAGICLYLVLRWRHGRTKSGITPLA